MRNGKMKRDNMEKRQNGITTNMTNWVILGEMNVNHFEVILAFSTVCARASNIAVGLLKIIRCLMYEQGFIQSMLGNARHFGGWRQIFWGRTPPPPLKYFWDCVHVQIFSGKGEYF
jgi:hypothetical protein